MRRRTLKPRIKLLVYHLLKVFSIFIKIAKLSKIVDLLAKGLSRLERVGNGSDFAYVKFNGSQVRSFLSINQRMVFSTN